MKPDDPEDVQVIHMRFRKALLARVDRLRRHNGLTRTATVQWLVRRGLEAMRDAEAARKVIPETKTDL